MWYSPSPAPCRTDLLSYDFVVPHIDHITPEVLFERRWALSLLERVMTRLRAHYAAGKQVLLQTLEMFLHPESETRYEETARQLGVSAGALRMAAHRMRGKYRSLLRAEIRETVATPSEIDEEIRFLLSTLDGV